MKQWINKITGEYRKSGMNPVAFIYWTIRSDIDEYMMSRAKAKREKQAA